MKRYSTTMFPVFILLGACASSTKPDPTSTPSSETIPEVDLADRATALCAPGSITGTLPAGTGITDATFTLEGQPTDLVLEPGLDGAFAIDVALLPFSDFCTPAQAPCALEARLTVALDGQMVSDDATLTLTDDGVGTAFIDGDGDGYGSDTASPELVCDGNGYADRQGDCDDSLATVNEGVISDACNGLDDDCDGSVDEDALFTDFYPDLDGDGFGAAGVASEVRCEVPDAAEALASNNADCSDDPSLDPNAAAVFPGAIERCDGYDNDCDGGVDDQDPEGADEGIAHYLDEDLDGAFHDQAATGCTLPGVEGVHYMLTAPPQGEEDCDDHDAALNRLDADQDGWATCDGDCDDDVSAVNPGASELLGNDIDEDCNGAIGCYVDTDNDGHGSPTSFDLYALPATLSCSDDSNGFASNSDDCLDSNAQAYPGATDFPDDDVDQDCDSFYECFVDGDGDGYGTSVTAVFPTPCSATAGASTLAGDCDDNGIDGNQSYPGNTEVVGNTFDEDCSLTFACYLDADDDGFAPLTAGIVEGPEPCDLLPGGGGATTPTTVGVDIDCNDASIEFAPGLDDSSIGDPDYDCDGLVTCYLDDDDDTFGVAVAADSTVTPGGVSNCDNAPNVASNTDDCLDTDGFTYPGAPEVACDGIEQDCLGNRPDARVAILADPAAGFSPDDITFDGSGEEQLTEALAVALTADTVRLCAAESYRGSFHIDQPIILEGGGATFDGGYVTPQLTDCAGGDEPVLSVDAAGTTALYDLTIMGGCADPNTSPYAGGLLVAGTSFLEATNVAISANAAASGGGIAVADSAVVEWVSGELSSNNAEFGGGAWVGSNATLLVGDGRSTFEVFGNSATYGGGFYSTGVLEVWKSSLFDNTAETGGAVRAGGAADFLDTTISDNTAVLQGGGVYSQGTATFTNSTLSNNATEWGGGLWASGSATFVDSTLSNNVADYGGGVYVYSLGTVALVSSTLYGNTASTGGGIYSNGATSFDQAYLSSNTAGTGNTISLAGPSASFTYTIAPGGNGDATPNIACISYLQTYSTTDTYSSCDAEFCYP